MENDKNISNTDKVDTEEDQWKTSNNEFWEDETDSHVDFNNLSLEEFMSNMTSTTGNSSIITSGNTIDKDLTEGQFRQNMFDSNYNPRQKLTGSYSSNYSFYGLSANNNDEQIDDDDPLSMSFFTKLLYKSSINNQHTNLTEEDMSLGSQEVDGFVDTAI